MLTGVLRFASLSLLPFLFSLGVCVDRIIANVSKKCVCVCLVTLGVNAATTVGIKWHHVGKNT